LDDAEFIAFCLDRFAQHVVPSALHIPGKFSDGKHHQIPSSATLIARICEPLSPSCFDEIPRKTSSGYLTISLCRDQYPPTGVITRNQFQPQVVEFGARIFGLKPYAMEASRFFAHS
jgi:hypothetical protein